MENNLRFKYEFLVVFGISLDKDFTCLTKQGYAVELSAIDFATAKKDGKVFIIIELSNKPSHYGLARQSFDEIDGKFLGWNFNDPILVEK